MSINISGLSGLAGIPSPAEMGAFSSGLKGSSTNDLVKMLGQPGMEPWQKDAISKELQTRAESSQSAGGGGSGGEDIQKLLKKLEDGTITDAELKQLAGMLGVDPTTLEAAKGKGGGNTGGDSGNHDIQGG
ncbi:hypothetical protein [Collimonas sp.]|uniref:hypothetical protein n=1 Tax=Collimonas sp. TaxID=1963772 RepID=UPI002C293C7D|nr:hypothetical protein [Collimonas sp.]HWW08237.1 hypothetical protein [Collimonas sp.]